MNREIIKIDEEKCNGCGQCVPNCHEGALQIIDGKAILISDLMCDGLGACLGHCPEGALEIVVREAAPYNEKMVMADMVKKTKNVVIAHLKHLADHNEKEYLRQGIEYLRDNESSIQLDVNEIISTVQSHKADRTNAKQTNTLSIEQNAAGCPGARTKTFKPIRSINPTLNEEMTSALAQWPVQMHLINPVASHFQQSDFVLAADCVAYSYGSFHQKFLKGKTLGIACPKLDQNKEIYLGKLIRLIDEAQINSITVIIMEVPCCGGLLQLVQAANQKAKRKAPVKAITIGIQGEILSEAWI